jgi:capsule polysaccharide export protein KpsE/RkpR
MVSAPQSVFSLAGLRAIFNRWKYLLGLAGVLALVISSAIVLSMPDIYSSVAIFLPTSLQSADPDRLADVVEGPTKNAPRLELSTNPADLDRVLSVGQSLPVAQLMIRKFDLYRHYKMGNPGSDAAETKTLREFASNLSIIHNERDAIELTFQDEDKQLAARIANTMVATIDSINQQLTLQNRRNVLELYRQSSTSLGRTYEQSRQALIRARRRYGVYGIKEQGRYLAKAIIETEKELRIAENGGPGNAAALRRALRGLTSADGGNVINLEGWTAGNDSVTLASERLTDLQTRFIAARGAYEQAEISLRSRVSSLYLVQKAQPATKASKPLRSLIVVGSVLLTLGISVLTILLLELFWRRPVGSAT